jgi:hypothetical protein
MPFPRVSRPVALLAAAGAVAAGPAAPPAAADDAAVARAYRSQDAAGDDLRARGLVAYALFDRAGRTGPLLTVSARARTLVVRVRRAVLAQSASTPDGARARALALRAVGLGERALLAADAGLRAHDRGEAVTARRLLARAETLGRYALRDDRRVRALFAALRV